MSPMNLPAHLQNQQVPDLTSRALDGLGASLPPHISIQGNSFTLIDSAGNEQPMGAVMEACIVDMSDVMGKRYYENDWTPGSDDPPTCWSMNGLAPSRDAMTPQSSTCASCQWNVRGSAVSKSGASIKACRDEKPMALLFPQFPNMLFQLVLTPGSFKNWSAYMAQFKQHQVNIADVLTSFSFQAKANGVLEFKPAQQIWIDAPTAEARGKALAAKATDALVGRLDRPIQAALAAPAGQTAPNPTSPTAQNPLAHQPQSISAQPAAQPAANLAFGGSPQPQGSPLNGGATHAAPSEPARRTRRTKAQIEADNAAQAAGTAQAAPFGGQAHQAAQPAAMPATDGFQPAPFRPNPAPEQGASPFGAGSGGPAPAPAANGFGMQAGAPINPELDAAIKNVFGQ